MFTYLPSSFVTEGKYLILKDTECNEQSIFISYIIQGLILILLCEQHTDYKSARAMEEPLQTSPQGEAFNVCKVRAAEGTTYF